MLTDPFKFPVASGTNVLVADLPLVGVGIDQAVYTSSFYRSGAASSAGWQFMLNHQYNKRFRHTLRLNSIKRDSLGVADTASVIMIVDSSPAPTASLNDLLSGFAWTLTNGLSSASDGVSDVTEIHQDIIDFLSGES